MDRKLTHLNLIQGVINRLSGNSFLLKGWSVVLVSALFALSASGSNVTFVLLAYFPAIMFWGLDGYFLSLERAYRKHYEQVIKQGPEQIDFSMDVSGIHKGFPDWTDATISKTLIPFHGVLIAAIALVTFLQL